ncbi:chaperonin 10-like protein [Favolaschia claudopus]|uniref:Chaperonin 10-like protein n=1 Tax=Favolaschia claudopus TaxID=2862362 RepID=A0AAW0C0S4_9AGAR
MSTMKAVVCNNGNIALKDIPKPKSGPTEVLVKVFAAAQNPPDNMKITFGMPEGAILGHDFAGRVEAIGAEVPPGVRFLGERVAGFVNSGADEEASGAFAEYCVANASVLVSLPDSLAYEDAAGLGMAGFTAAQALWTSQKGIPAPKAPAAAAFPILVWAGATAVGQYTIQLAKLSGLRVVTTASPKNHELLKTLGADAVFDYRDAEVVSKIRAWTDNQLAHAVDCISDATTTRQVAACIGTSGGSMALMLKEPVDAPGVHAQFDLCSTMLGKPWDHPIMGLFPVIPEHYEFGKATAQLLTQLLREGKLRTTPVKLVPNGLSDVGEWLEYMKQGKVSGEKITYRVAQESK